MAGARQHYTTAHLLNGFGSLHGNTIKTYLYRRGGPQGAFVSVRDVAVQRHFYSKEYPGSLDELVTNYETERLTGAVDMLRQCGLYDGVDTELAAEVVTHFVVRGIFFREHLAESLTKLIQGAIKRPDLLPITPRDVADAAVKRIRYHIPLLRPVITVFVGLFFKTPNGRALLDNVYQQTFSQWKAVPWDRFAEGLHKDFLQQCLTNPENPMGMRSCVKGT